MLIYEIIKLLPIIQIFTYVQIICKFQNGIKLPLEKERMYESNLSGTQ